MSRLRSMFASWSDRKARGEFHPLSIRRSPLLRAVLFYIWDYPFTRAGKLLIAAFFFSTLPGAITDDVPIYVVPVALLSLVLVLSAIGSVFRLARCQVKTHWPPKVSAGQAVTVPVTVTNTGLLPIYDLAAGCFEAPEGWEVIRDDVSLPVLARRQTETLHVRLIPWRRGAFAMPPLRVFSTFPFHLFRNEVTLSPKATVLVLPRFHEMSEVPLDAVDRHQPGGMAYTSQVGESPEYIGNRDYIPGDALRRIDFRSWARLARPIVREYQDEYYSRVALVLDTFIPPRRRPGRQGFPEFEAAVSLTAAVSEAVSRGETVIDIFAAGAEMHVFRTGRNTTPFEHILEILASVSPCRKNPFDMLTAALAEQLPFVSTLICVFVDWNDERRLLCRKALEAGCRVKAVVIRPAPFPVGMEPGVELVQLSPQQVEAGVLRL